MVIDKNNIQAMFLAVSQLWKEETPRLNEIDSRFGDGDHGVTINKIAVLVENSVNSWGDENLYDFICELGDNIMSVNGGSAGPLYGTMVGGLAEPLEGVEEIDEETLKAMFRGSLSAMEDITKAKVGDKTMMDALIPAVEAAENTDGDIKEILIRAKEAALKGAQASEQFVSKFGRARSYKEQTIGTPDAGAVSAAIFFKGLEAGYN